MGRKKNKSSETNYDSSSEDNASQQLYFQHDALSENYTIGSETTLDENNDDLDDISNSINFLSDIINQLSDLSTERKKRSTSYRESLFRKLFKALSQHALICAEHGMEIIESNWENVIIPNCLIGVRSSSSTEQYTSLRCLEVLPFLLGSDIGDDLLDNVYDSLMKCLQNAGVASQVRSVSLRSLTMTAFVSGCTISSLNELLDLCRQVSLSNWRGHNLPCMLRCTAFDCWGVLSTLFDYEDIVENYGLEMFDSVRDGLESKDVHLRESAGKCLVLIHENRLNLVAEDDDKRWDLGSWDDSEIQPVVEELQEIVHSLSLESSHHLSKKAKKNQRAIFRDIYATFETSELPSETFTTSSTSLTLSSWRDFLIFDFIRKCLQSGLQIHLQKNQLLHQLFPDLTFEDNSSSLSNVEKRLIMSKTSEKVKKKDKDMIKMRKSRNNAKNYFITADGENL